jgi:uncharacterized membrane protein YbhN (UPF0104 family)
MPEGAEVMLPPRKPENPWNTGAVRGRDSALDMGEDQVAGGRELPAGKRVGRGRGFAQIVVLVKVCVTVGLLSWLFRNDRLMGAIVPQLSLMAQNWGWTLAGVACAGVGFFFEALRWWVLLDGQGCRVGRIEVLRTTLVAAFLNLTSLGTAGGDAFRVVSMSARAGVSRAAMLASVLLDHMLGTFGMGLLFLCTDSMLSGAMEAAPGEVRTLVSGFRIFIGVSVAGILLCAGMSSPRLYAFAERRHPALFGWGPLKAFVGACCTQWGNLRASGWAVVCSLVLYLGQYSTFYCGLRAVGAEAPVLAVWGVMPMVDAAAALPISVSGVGVREKAFETLMGGLVGLSSDTAVSASLAGWLLWIFWAFCGGALFILGSGGDPPARTAEPVAGGSAPQQ